MLDLVDALINSISVILADWSSLSAILYPIICVCIEFKVVAWSNFISGIFTLAFAWINSISVFLLLWLCFLSVFWGYAIIYP